MKHATTGRVIGALAVALCARAEIIDRVAVAIGTQVITESELLREIRTTAFLNGAAPDFSVETKKETAERLIEQKLVRRELELSAYPAPAPSEIEPVLKEFIAKRFGTEERYREALDKAGLTDGDIRDELLWQRTLLKFIEFRFQPAVQVTDRDVRNYFEARVLPEAQKANPGKPVSLDDYRERIERALTGERADKELDQWLRETRRHTHIEYREAVFQ